jgi:hypothetical protein
MKIRTSISWNEIPQLWLIALDSAPELMELQSNLLLPEWLQSEQLFSG